MPPKVSVCIPVYNRRGMLRAAVWSVLCQTYRDFEIVISDNASDEDIAAEVVAINDPRIRYIRQDNNVGAAANFCFLQTVASGDYILFLCSDDLLLPECLAKAVAALDSQPQSGGVVYMAAHYSERGFQFLSTMPDRDYAGPQEYESDPTVNQFTFVSPSFCLYRREVFERLGGWNPNLLAVIDYDLYARMIRNGGGLIFLHQVLAIMRFHDNRMSNTSALHWDFYYDVMLMSAQPEYQWGNAYRALVVVEQLLWDWRLKRWPWRTLAHAYNMKALPGVLLYVPWELLRRVNLKFRKILERDLPKPLPASSSRLNIDECDMIALEAVWRAAETVRTGNVAELSKAAQHQKR